MKYLASLLALAVGLWVGCSKETANQAQTEARVKTADLGVIDVADGVEALFDLGEGRSCRLTPAFQPDDTVLLEMIIEENGQVLSRPRIKTPFNLPVKISVGETSVALTARKKA